LWDDAFVSHFLSDWEAWHEAREQRLRDPRGWLGITAIHWLSDAPQRFDDLPGDWSSHDLCVTVTLSRGEALTVGSDVLAEGAHELGPLDEAGVMVIFRDAVVEVALRGGAAIVRPRHPDSLNLRAYQSTPCYRPDARWVIPARFISYPASRHRSGGQPDEEAVGEVLFEYGGSEHRLVTWGEDDGSLWILFRDATSGATTYPAGRQLLTKPPTNDGRVDVDFTRTINLPCAYTDFVTCPVPPDGNTLPFAVEAGEQLPAMISA
jgi:uncharacterized protein (DUF1684 family)